MTGEIETYEVRAVAMALRDNRYAMQNELTWVESARLILTALKLAQARAEKRKIKENHRLFYEHAAKHEAYWARIQPIHPPAEA